ncbi:MAG: glutamate-5-semialdehyde dehydrogenase, partial [Eggerthellales bacterium]|nr:glutamate-5-semialdehyde dehydrogenase [Eggerthellales bacterium]
MKESVYEQVRQTALKAKAASESLALIDAEQRNRAMRAMAQALRQDEEAILEANARDMEAGRASGMTEALLDRLELTAPRIQAMACALEDLATLPDPVGRVIEERTITCDLLLRKQSCPLGVVAMVYEARPNVTVDAAGICLKTANACVLRGGSQALHSNLALVASMRRAAAESGIPQDAICAIDTTDRSATDALMSLHGIVDVLIPRGGAGLIRHCVDNAKVPVIETGTGNCHIYIHRTADLTRALNILVNAKTQRTGVCNACESVLIDRECADRVL